MMKKVVISEIDSFQSKIDSLIGEAVISHALVEQIVTDLETNSNAMSAQKNDIDRVIQNLTEKKKVLEASISSNAQFIKKLKDACSCDECSE